MKISNQLAVALGVAALVIIIIGTSVACSVNQEVNKEAAVQTGEVFTKIEETRYYGENEITIEIPVDSVVITKTDLAMTICEYYGSLTRTTRLFKSENSISYDEYHVIKKDSLSEPESFAVHMSKGLVQLFGHDKLINYSKK